MPKQKDLKRAVRTRMQKTGESYTTARLHLVKKQEEPNYAELAGMSEDAIRAKTGRGWREWVALLDAAQCAGKPHGEIARYVSSLGTPGWWSQSVTVGYERIRGLRAIGQRRDGGYEASKSRTVPVGVASLYAAFAQKRRRDAWLPNVALTVRTSVKDKSMRITWPDETRVEVAFTAKGPEKSAVTVTHRMLASRAAVDEAKASWGAHLDALAATLARR